MFSFSVFVLPSREERKTWVVPWLAEQQLKPRQKLQLPEQESTPSAGEVLGVGSGASEKHAFSWRGPWGGQLCISAAARPANEGREGPSRHLVPRPTAE